MGGCCSAQESDYVERRPRQDYDGSRVNVSNRDEYRLQEEHELLGVQKSCYGEYRCPRCGRFWSSTLSWRNSYLVCRRCSTHVYPHNQREVRPSDYKHRDGKAPEHSKELCQKCQEFGYYCANYNKGTRGQARSRNVTQVYCKY